MCTAHYYPYGESVSFSVNPRILQITAREEHKYQLTGRRNCKTSFNNHGFTIANSILINMKVSNIGQTDAVRTGHDLARVS